MRKVGRPKGSAKYKNIVKLATSYITPREAIVNVMRTRASGRVPMSSTEIATKIYILYGIDITADSVRYHLRVLAQHRTTEKANKLGMYRLVQSSPQLKIA